jgi:hypothetical protein
MEGRGMSNVSEAGLSGFIPQSILSFRQRMGKNEKMKIIRPSVSKRYSA